MKMTKGYRVIVSIIMVLVIVFAVTILKYTEQRVELEETKQELAEYKADELEIYPCPFCGSEDVELKDDIGWYVRCKDCNGIGPSHSPNDIWSDNTKTEAIELWNASYKRGNKE